MSDVFDEKEQSIIDAANARFQSRDDFSVIERLKYENLKPATVSVITCLNKCKETNERFIEEKLKDYKLLGESLAKDTEEIKQLRPFDLDKISTCINQEIKTTMEIIEFQTQVDSLITLLVPYRRTE